MSEKQSYTPPTNEIEVRTFRRAPETYTDILHSPNYFVLAPGRAHSDQFGGLLPKGLTEANVIVGVDEILNRVHNPAPYTDKDIIQGITVHPEEVSITRPVVLDIQALRTYLHQNPNDGPVVVNSMTELINGQLREFEDPEFIEEEIGRSTYLREEKNQLQQATRTLQTAKQKKAEFELEIRTDTLEERLELSTIGQAGQLMAISQLFQDPDFQSAVRIAYQSDEGRESLGIAGTISVADKLHGALNSISTQIEEQREKIVSYLSTPKGDHFLIGEHADPNFIDDLMNIPSKEELDKAISSPADEFKDSQEYFMFNAGHVDGIRKVLPMLFNNDAGDQTASSHRIVDGTGSVKTVAAVDVGMLAKFVNDNEAMLVPHPNGGEKPKMEIMNYVLYYLNAEIKQMFGPQRYMQAVKPGESIIADAPLSRIKAAYELYPAQLVALHRFLDDPNFTSAKERYLEKHTVREAQDSGAFDENGTYALSLLTEIQNSLSENVKGFTDVTDEQRSILEKNNVKLVPEPIFDELLSVVTVGSNK